MTAPARSLALSEVVDLLDGADTADGGLPDYRRTALLWSLLTGRVSPDAAVKALLDGDLERLDGLIFQH